MNFRVLRGIRPILISLSILASSSQVESAKIDVNFIADVLDKFAEYKEGEFDAEKAFKEDFDYLDKEVFNSELYHDFERNMSEFNQYLAMHTLRKFFDCNEPIKKSFKFVHKNIKELVFLLHDFKGSDAFGYRILEALKNCGLKKSRFTGIKTYDMKKTKENSNGSSMYFKYSNVLGLMSEGWHEEIQRKELRGTGVYLEDLVREEMRNHLGKDKFEKLEKRVGSNRLYGILSFMLATIHEITHHVGRYLGALERLEVAESDNPISMLSGKHNSSLFFRAYSRKDIKTLGGLFEASGAKGRIDEVKAYRKSLENEFNSKLSLEDLVQELGKKADERKAEYRYFGHSEYAAEKLKEDISDSIALSMMPCCVDLAGPEALRECLNAYADKLLSSCK